MKAALIAMLDVDNLPRYVRSILALGLLAAFVYEIHLGNELAVTALGPLTGAAITYYFVKEAADDGP